MATYTVSPATPDPQNLPVPTADAWVQPLGGGIRISQDETMYPARAGVLQSGEPYPIDSGAAWKYTSVGGRPVHVVMWDK